MPNEVSEFIVVAPAMRCKEIQFAQDRLLAYLELRFPTYGFRVEPYGPLSSDDEFTIVPIMNSRQPQPSLDDVIVLARLDPVAIPQIAEALRHFDPSPMAAH